MSKLEELTGVFSSIRWRSPDVGSNFVIANLQSGDTVKGDAPEDELIPGLSYRFFGQWDQPHPRYGPSFKFKSFAKCEPHSRFGLVNYLKRYAPHVGPAIATRLFDKYAGEACKLLRTDPERVAREVRGLTLDRAREASAALSALSELEDTKIELTNLFAGRGFPGVLIDQCIRRWGPLAPKRIQRDPFTLLVHGLTGCGFARCDRLYLDLGQPPGRLKRQMICLWHALKSDNDGHTWFPVATAEQKLRENVSGAKVNLRKAVTLGIRSGWLAVRLDDEGQRWIAHGEKARNEQTVAESIKRLMAGKTEALPRFTEPIEGECDATDQFVSPAEFERLEKNWREGGGEADATEDIESLLRLGRQTGICQFCGRRLVHPISVALGIGPVCAARYGVEWVEPAACQSEPTERTPAHAEPALA